ncbi:MAG TPA: hypothetical protein ENN68_02090 [Methanomicrobia archaeon]|nr:hypothetical protein [Methanomicrobia archaeon]
MQSLSIDLNMAVRRKLIWCFYWTSRKAIRTEGCAPFLIKRILSGETTINPEPGYALTLTDELLQRVEDDLKAGKRVSFTIKQGAEMFELVFQNHLFSVAAHRNSELAEEIIESLQDDLMQGQPNFCTAFVKRLRVDLYVR